MKRWRPLTRRDVLSLSLITGLLFGSFDVWAAIGIGAVPTPTAAAATTLATLTLVNTSGSTQAANFVTRPFGMFFKKGDIPSGTYPQFIPTGGSACAYTMWGQSVWSDGSLKSAGFFTRVGVSIAGSSSISLVVKTNGAAPGTSSRATGDLSAQDLKVILTGIDNLSGTTTSSLNTGITNNTEVLLIADGGAGKIWRIRQPFTGSPSPGECYHYVQSLQNSAGGLYGLRWQPRSLNGPWLDINSPTKQKIGFTASVQNGASVLTSPSPGAAKTFTATNGNNLFTCTGHGYETGCPVRPSGGSLPPNVSASTTYYIRFVDANTVQLDTVSAFDAVSGGTLLTPSGNGSGTFTPHPELVWGASFFGGNTDGTWLYVQGGGTVAAECTVRVTYDKAYAISTRLIPPWNRALSVTGSTTANTYFPNGHSQLSVDFEQTGPTPAIGTQPAWAAAHFQVQDANDEQITRVTALCMGNLPICVKNSTTSTLAVINNTSYTGMPTPTPTMRWQPSNGGAVGFTSPTGDQAGPYGNIDQTSHWPSALYYAWLITGDPAIMDLLLEDANYVVMTRNAAASSRNPVISGVQYYGACMQDPNQARTDAWGVREVALAAGVCPTSHWENAQYATYFGDLAGASWKSINAFNAASPSVWSTNGLYQFRTDDPSGAPWQHNFLISAAAMAYAVTESTDALTFLNHLIKWPKAVDTDVGIYHWTCFTTRVRISDGASGTNGFAVSAMSWSAGTVTATTTGAHGIGVGQMFQLIGSVPVGYDGVWTATAGTTGTTLKFAVTNNPGAYVGNTVAFTLLQGMADIFYCPGGGFGWLSNAGTALLTAQSNSGQIQFTLTAGDGVCFMLTSDLAPTALSNTPTTYTLNTLTDPGVSSDKTFKVGGATVTQTKSGEFMCLRMQTIPASGTGLDYINAIDGYKAIMDAAFRYAEAVGANSMTALRTKADTILNNNTNDWTSSAFFCQWNFNANFS